VGSIIRGMDFSFISSSLKNPPTIITRHGIVTWQRRFIYENVIKAVVLKRPVHRAVKTGRIITEYMQDPEK
jgi:hypothetical protein